LPHQGQGEPGDNNNQNSNTPSIEGTIQRACTECESEKSEQPAIQRQPLAQPNNLVFQLFSQRIQRTVKDTLQLKASTNLENQLNSKKGGGSPLDSETPGKNKLTAHELTHVVQQDGAVRMSGETLQAKKLSALETSVNFNLFKQNQFIQLKQAERKTKSQKSLLSPQRRAALARVIRELLNFFKALGEFVAGAVYQWLYHNGQPARWLLQLLVPGWNGLEQDVEKGLPKTLAFQLGRSFGDGAALVNGILEIVGGGGAAGGGAALCVTGIGCIAGAPAAAAGVALGVHGTATASSALRSIIERLGIVFKSTNQVSGNSGNTPNPGAGVGGNGTASEFGSLDGMTYEQVESFLTSRGATKKPGSEYDTFTFPDKSKVTLRHSDGRITRTPAPKYDNIGRNITKGKRLDQFGKLLNTRNPDGSQIPGAHDSNEFFRR
jgi:hypothetical protein